MKKTAAVVLLLLSSSCKSKSGACKNAEPVLDRVNDDLLRTAAAMTERLTPGDSKSCAEISQEIGVLEAEQAKLSLLVVEDAGLAQQVAAYRSHVDDWAKASRISQGACVQRNGNALTDSRAEVVRHRLAGFDAFRNIKAYCKAP